MSDDPEREYIYAIGHPHNYTKIGHSSNPNRRLRSIQIGSPYKLWVIAQFPVANPKQVEAALHDHWSDKHERGEWYDLEIEDFDELSDLVKMASSTREFESLAAFRDWQGRKWEAMR